MTPLRYPRSKYGDTLTLRIPRELVSPNKWNGRHWREKNRLTKGWEKDIWATACAKDGSVLRVAHEKRRLRVTRETPTTRSFIRDTDNCYGACKPLCDALNRLGLIVDDSQEWLELAPLEQRVSADGLHWTVIELESVVGE